LAVAVIGSVLVIAAPVSAAAIALVTLGRSVRDGAWVALWSMLPALLLGWVSGDYGTGLLLLSVFVGAAVLAQTYSLSLALLAVVPVSALGGVALLAFNSAFLDALLTVFDTWIEALESGADETAVIGLLTPSVPQVAGLMAVGNSLLACLSLLLGRYWQAALYKPGAFGDEFRALRLPSVWAAGLVLVTVAGALGGRELAAWTALAGIPVTICGFALLHHVARDRQLGFGFLAVSYMLWTFVDLLKVGVLVAVLLDAFFDFGRRAKAS
ncbi:MAG: hypothetical protein VXW75_00005, partial [Pseudomonadota bacterium]|nr:hypothetical protein [Pseudomonadota bacterium]